MSLKLKWVRSGIWNPRVDVYSEENQHIGTLQRTGFFVNKTLVSFDHKEYIFGYEASFFDNVVVKDNNGKLIGKYKADFGFESGQFAYADKDRQLIFRREGKVYEYNYSMSLLDYPEKMTSNISKQSGRSSEGIIESADHFDKLEIMLMIYLVVLN